jgi:hypothetical protein
MTSKLHSVGGVLVGGVLNESYNKSKNALISEQDKVY